jgi:hypothetical protein
MQSARPARVPAGAPAIRRRRPCPRPGGKTTGWTATVPPPAAGSLSTSSERPSIASNSRNGRPHESDAAANCTRSVIS